MLITCPECQFARNINGDSIPSTAQIATCPRCQSKFRFRVLPDEFAETEDHEQVDETEHDVADDVSAVTASPEEQAEESPFYEDVLDDLLRSAEAAEELQESAENQVPEDIDDEYPPVIERAESDELEVQHAEELDSSVPDTEVPEVDASDVVPPVFSEPVEEPPLSQPVQDEIPGSDDVTCSDHVPCSDHVSCSDDVNEAEDEVVQRYSQVKESSGMEAASSHIVRDADSGKHDIWDTIAAMGEEDECADSDDASCGAMPAHVIPWEDGRLNCFSRLSGTFRNLFVHPRSFWRGINATNGLVLPFVFFMLSCLVAGMASLGWLQGITASWPQISGVIQPVLASRGIVLSAMTIPDSSMLPVVVVGLLVIPFVLGGITHTVARMIGGCASPFGAGFRSVAYSSGALLWILVPVAGAVLSLLYLLLLYVHGVRAGYNLSLFRSVVTVLTVGLLLAAAVLMVTAGVSFM